ncbi:MAG: hypothetical protein K2Z81_09585, partial [Cyanobacteria bacterium]|nr:hypothetical protein [Cyanobacteriota bacterium]
MHNPLPASKLQTGDPEEIEVMNRHHTELTTREGYDQKLQEIASLLSRAQKLISEVAFVDPSISAALSTVSTEPL